MQVHLYHQKNNTVQKNASSMLVKARAINFGRLSRVFIATLAPFIGPHILRLANHNWPKTTLPTLGIVTPPNDY